MIRFLTILLLVMIFGADLRAEENAPRQIPVELQSLLQRVQAGPQAFVPVKPVADASKPVVVPAVPQPYSPPPLPVVPVQPPAVIATPVTAPLVPASMSDREALKEVLAAVSDDMRAQREIIKEQRNRVDGMEAKIDEALVRVAAIEETSEQHAASMVRIIDLQERNSQRIVGLEGQVSSLRTQLITSNQRADQLTSQVHQAQRQVGAMQGQVNSLSKKLEHPILWALFGVGD